jgi:hypothetical protein
MSAEPPRSTDQLQRWLLAVVTDPRGVASGLVSDEARRWIALGADDAESVVTRSKNLSAEERLAIYATSYYLRLLDCLANEFPIVKATLGEDLFNDFAMRYLQRFPSHSYTLHRLGENLARFLAQDRPGREDWSDFLIDLVRLEWAIGEVFDGPGAEGQPPLSADQLAAISPGDWPGARVRTVVCLRLLAFDYPVSPFYTKARRGETPPIPQPQPSFMALTRRDFVVRRHVLSRPQFELLTLLATGGTVAEAIAAAARISDQTEAQFSASLESWFNHWAREGFFAAVDV